MKLFRYLHHWLTGRGPRLQGANFVPEIHPIHQWADTFPWPVLVAAIDRSSAQRFPMPRPRGRPLVSTRVLLALELLIHELACSDEQICSRLRTDLAVMYACGITAVQVDGSQGPFVLPKALAHFRSRLDVPLMAELLAIQAATAMEEGFASPARLVVDPFPSEQGSQRVNDAATLYKAQNSPPGHHGHNHAVRPQRHSAPEPSSATPTSPPESDAPLRSPLSEDGESVCDAGTSDGDAIAGDGTAGAAAGASRPSVSVRCVPGVEGSAGASGHLGISI
jgi:transposase-like protein DUF772